MPMPSVKGPEMGVGALKMPDVKVAMPAPQALAGGIEAGLSAPHTTLSHLAELKTDLPPPTPGTVPESTTPPSSSGAKTAEIGTSVTSAGAEPVEGSSPTVEVKTTTSETGTDGKPTDAGGTPKDSVEATETDMVDKKTADVKDSKAEADGTKTKSPEELQREADIKDAEQKGEAAFESMANGTPEETEKAITDFQEAANKINGIKESLDGNHKAAVKKAVGELLSKGPDGKESREAQELRMRLQSMMQMEGQLMVYRQQLDQVRKQYDQTRDKLKSIDQWWNKSVYDKDPKKRMEKYALYSQLIGLQEVGKKLVNTVHEAKAVYAKNVSVLNSKLRVHGVLGTMADYIVAKGYQIEASAHRNSDWLVEKVTGGGY